MHISEQAGFTPTKINGVGGAYSLTGLSYEHQKAAHVQAIESEIKKDQWVSYGGGLKQEVNNIEIISARIGSLGENHVDSGVTVDAVRSIAQSNCYIFARFENNYTNVVKLELVNDGVTGEIRYRTSAWRKPGNNVSSIAEETIGESNGYSALEGGEYEISDLNYRINTVTALSGILTQVQNHSVNDFAERPRREGNTEGNINFEGAGGGNLIESDVSRGDIHFSGAGAANIVIKKGLQGDLVFRGAGLANVLLHLGAQGRMDVYAAGAANVLIRRGDGNYLARLLAYGNISVHHGDGDGQVLMLGGANAHTHIGRGREHWLAAGGFNVFTKVGSGAVDAVMAGGGNVLSVLGGGDLSAGLLGGANVVSHIHQGNGEADTRVIALGGANVLTKYGDGTLQAMLGGQLNVLTHIGQGATQAIMLGAANVLTKVGEGDLSAVMLGWGNVLSHVGNGRTLGVMAAAGNIFTKVGDGTSIAAMVGAGNVFTHIGQGDAWALMGGVLNVFTKVGDGKALALMIAKGNIFTHVGNGLTVALMLAKGNVATKVGDGMTLAAMIGGANVFSQIGHGETFAAMIGKANVLTKVGDGLTAALMAGKANVFTQVGHGISLGLFAGDFNLMTKVGNGATLAAAFGKANVMTHVGSGITGVLALGKANIVTKVGDGLLGVLAKAEANVVTHVGNGVTAALLLGKGNVLTKVGNGATVGLLVSDVGNVLTQVGEGLQIGFAKGKANLMTKVGAGDQIVAAWGELNVLTHVGDGLGVRAAKGRANVLSKIGQGGQLSIVQGEANVVTHIGDGDDYVGAWGRANVVTKVGAGRQVTLAKGEANIITQVGQGDGYQALLGRANLVTKVGDGIQVTAAKGEANIVTTVGDGLSVTAVYGKLNSNIKVGSGTRVNVAWGNYNLNTQWGDGLNVAVMKGRGNANIQIGDGMMITAAYARNNVVVKVGNGDFYSLAVASSNTASNKLAELFGNIKQTLLGAAASQAINYLVQGDEGDTSGVSRQGRGGFRLPGRQSRTGADEESLGVELAEVQQLQGFRLDEISQTDSSLASDLRGQVSRPQDVDEGQHASRLSIDEQSVARTNLIVNGDFEQYGHGWQSTHGIEAWLGAGVYGLSAEAKYGQFSSELSTDRNTTIYQDLDGLRGGQTITLDFDFARRLHAGLEHGIEVRWNNVLVFSSQGDAAEWQHKQLQLTAVAGRNRISFSGTGPENSLGYVIDNVAAYAAAMPDVNVPNMGVQVAQDQAAAERDQQRLEQEKKRQLADIEGSLRQLEASDEQQLSRNGDWLRDVLNEEADAVTSRLGQMTHGLESFATPRLEGGSGHAWRDRFAADLPADAQEQLARAQAAASDALNTVDQQHQRQQAKRQEALQKSERGRRRSEEARLRSQDQARAATAQGEEQRVKAQSAQQQAQARQEQANQDVELARQRGAQAAEESRQKVGQAASDAKSVQQQSDAKPEREVRRVAVAEPPRADAPEPDETTEANDVDEIDGEAGSTETPGQIASDLGGLEDARAAVNRLQINAGVRARSRRHSGQIQTAQQNADVVASLKKDFEQREQGEVPKPNRVADTDELESLGQTSGLRSEGQGSAEEAERMPLDGLITRQALQQEASVFAKRIGPSYRAILDGLERLSTVGGDTQLVEGLALHQRLSRYLAEHPTSGRNPALGRLRAQLEEKMFAGDMLSRREDLLAVAKESPQLAVRLYQLAREAARSGDTELGAAAIAWARLEPDAALAHLNALVDVEPGKTWRVDKAALAGIADEIRRATGNTADPVSVHGLPQAIESTHDKQAQSRLSSNSSGRMDFIDRVMQMPDAELERYLVRKNPALKPLCDYVFRGVDLPDGRFGRITSQFVSKQHLLAFSVASSLGNFAVSAREAGALTLERLADGAAAKGHDILEKTVKGSSLSGAYGAEGAQKLAWLQELGLAGLVGHWHPETKALLGFYVTPDLYALRDASDEAMKALGQQVKRVDADHFYFPVDMRDAESLRRSTELLRASPQWQQKMYTGDYDLHDMLSFSGRAHSVPSSSQTERFIRGMLNAAVAAKDESRPLRRGSHHTVQHGPQVSYPAHMGAHEQGVPLVGAVANPSFPLALCDRGVWQPIVHDTAQLQGAYQRMGARLKVTWQPGEDHPRFVPDGENGQVRMVRRPSQDSAGLPSDSSGPRHAVAGQGMLSQESEPVVKAQEQLGQSARRDLQPDIARSSARVPAFDEDLEALGGRQVAKDYLNKFDNIIFFLPNSPNYGEQAINSRPIREISESLMGEGKKLVVLTNEDYNFKQRVRLGLRVEGEDANRFDTEDFLRFFAQSEVEIHKDTNGKWSFNYSRDMVASETNQFEVEDLIERYRDELRGRSDYGEALDLDIKLKEFHSFTEGKPSNDESFKRAGANIEIEFTHQLDYISAREKLIKLCPGVEDKVQFLDLTESDGANFVKLLTEKNTLILSGATDTRTSIFDSYASGVAESTRVTEIMMGDKDHGARRGVYVNGKEVLDGFPKGIEESAIYPSVVDKNAIDRSNLAEAEKGNLNKLISHVSDAGMLYAYGFHQVPIENRLSLLDGMRDALIKSEAGKRSVIFVAGDVGIPISSESMDCVRIDDAVRFEAELSKKTNKPLVVLAGQLPSDVNDLVVSNSRLVIAEGKGTVSFCQQNNIRHLILRKREGGEHVVQVTQYHDSGNELLRKELELRSENLYSKDLNLVKNTISDVFLDVDDFFLKNHYKNMSSSQNLLLETLERIGSIQKIEDVDNDRHKLQSLSRYQENAERPILDISTELAQWRTEQVTSPTRGETASRFDGQLIFQMENDPVAARAAARLAGKHPDKSVLVQVGADGQYRVVHGELSRLRGKLRWQVVGHGSEGGVDGNGRLGGYDAESLAARLQHVSNDIARAHGIETQAEHVSLVGCSLVGSSRQDGYARGFFEAMERKGGVASVSARSSEVAVDSQGRKHTRAEQGDWLRKEPEHKVVFSRGEDQQLQVRRESMRSGIAEGDINLARVGQSSRASASGAIADNQDVFQAPKKRVATNQEADAGSDSGQLSYSGNIQLQLGDGEFTTVNWGTSNLGIKVGVGGMKSLVFGDNNVMVHIGDGDSQHSVDIAGYRALEGAQLFIGNRNVSFNMGRSNDLIVMADKSIPMPPLVNPFDGAARIAGVLQTIAGNRDQSQWLSAQWAQWTLAGVEKYLADTAGLDQTSSVDYASLTALDSQHQRSSRGLKSDIEATLNKKFNQWQSSQGQQGGGQLSRADKLRQMNEKLAFNFAVGGQGADIQITTANWNFVFGDNIQSILDTNLGSLFGLLTQQFTATGMAKTTFTFTPTDLPRQLQNRLLGRLAGVGSDTTLGDIFGVDYTAQGGLVSRSGDAIDGPAMLREMLSVIADFGGEQLAAFTDPARWLDALEAGAALGKDALSSFARSHGLQAAAPEETDDAPPPADALAPAETDRKAFGLNALHLPNLFATLFSQDKQSEMVQLLSNLKQNLSADLLNMQEQTFDFLRNSGHLQGDGDMHVSLGNYNFNWGGDGKDLGAYLGENNNFWGGRGDDVFYATGTSNVFSGGAGSDTGVLMGRENMMFGGAGDDVAVQAGRINHAYLGDGNDQAYVFGEGGVIDGGAGQDYLVVSGNYNSMDGGAGQDFVVAIGNHNQISLGQGNDYALVFGNHNRLQADHGRNQIKLMGYHAVVTGADESDYLIADSGSKFSELSAGAGDDVLVLGGYQNRFSGGTGVDSFVLSDAVIDCEVLDAEQDDYIVLDDIDQQDIWFKRNGDDLQILLNRCDETAGASDQDRFEQIGAATFNGYFSSKRAQIVLELGEVQKNSLRSYTALSHQAVDALVQAMSGFAPEAGQAGFINNMDQASRHVVQTAWSMAVQGEGKLIV